VNNIFNENYMGCIRPALHYEAWPKNLGPTLSIFGLWISPNLLINARTFTPWVANWPPKFDGVCFSTLGPIQGHKVQHLSLLGGDWKVFFSISTLTPSVKPLGVVSTFPQIGMLDLASTLALTPSVKWA
jgi:hypothetical protein